MRLIASFEALAVGSKKHEYLSQSVTQSISGSFMYFISLNQMTPLHVAVERARTEIVKYLVDRGADITIKDDNGVNIYV